MRLKPDFSYNSKFALRLINKIATGMESFVSVVASVGAWFRVVWDAKTQYADQVKIRIISQLISGISGVLQNYFVILMVAIF